MDAGTLREQLALELDEWTAAGFWPSHRAVRWHRRLRGLARALGITPMAVLDDLRSDLAALDAQREIA